MYKRRKKIRRNKNNNTKTRRRKRNEKILLFRQLSDGLGLTGANTFPTALHVCCRAARGHQLIDGQKQVVLIVTGGHRWELLKFFQRNTTNNNNNRNQRKPICILGEKGKWGKRYKNIYRKHIRVEQEMNGKKSGNDIWKKKENENWNFFIFS